MHNRLDFQQFLVSLLGSNRVYFQKPESLKLEFPAFIYAPVKVGDRFADNERYLKRRAYDVQYISKTYDESFVENMLSLPYCELNTTFIVDNLYHFNFTIFY